VALVVVVRYAILYFSSFSVSLCIFIVENNDTDIAAFCNMRPHYRLLIDKSYLSSNQFV
jgi:hypothetical protein